MAQQEESNFAYDHPALVATVVTIAILAGFLFMIYNSAKGHGGGHGSAHPSGSASGMHAPSAAPKPATH